MRIILAGLLALAAFDAHAFDTFAFPRGVVSKGDSTAALVQRAGQPDRIVTLENRRGAAVGERWEYFLRDKQVNFTISGGRITQVEELR